MDLELVLLYDYYGDLLTPRQKECFEMRYCQDLSLGEIGQLLGISRQGVHDNLNRTETLLRDMEAKTGCAGRDQACRRASRMILEAARQLPGSSGETATALAQKIISAAQELEE